MPMFQLTAGLSVLLALAGADTEEGPDDPCQSDCSSTVDPVILTPVDGATVESPLTVTVDPGMACECDTCGCTSAAVEGISIFANGERVAGGWGELGPFEIDLAPGMYELIAYSESNDDSGSSEPITITVSEGRSTGSDGESGNGESGDPTGEDGTGGEPDSGGEPKRGCTSTGSGPSWLGGLALLGLLVLRRRRA